MITETSGLVLVRKQRTRPNRRQTSGAETNMTAFRQGDPNPSSSAPSLSGVGQGEVCKRRRSHEAEKKGISSSRL